MILIETKKAYYFKCPACGWHYFPKSGPVVWKFNDSLTCPSFMPSMRIKRGNPTSGDQACCHFFVTAGQIQFQADCTHGYKAKTLPLEHFTEEEVTKFTTNDY